MTRTHSPNRRWIVLLAVSALACKTNEAAQKVPLAQLRADSAHSAAGVQAQGSLALTPETKIALDSGNVLFRKKAYSEALVQYRLASSRSPHHAAPYFGMYMVAQATHNMKLADSALANIRANNAAPPMAGFDHADTVGAVGAKLPVTAKKPS